MKICFETFFDTKLEKNILQDGTEDSGCQNATVPAEGKISRAVTIDEILLRNVFLHKT